MDPTTRFDGLAEIYAQYRPSYPEDAIDWICSHCGWGAGARIVDVGCGTGISTRALAERGFRAVGIEPNREMRQVAQNTPGPDGVSQVTYQDGCAESTGLDDGSVDGVLCAQSFHWFDASAALAEFFRILKPMRWVALLWNERDESDEFTKNYGTIIRSAPDAVELETRRSSAGAALLACERFEAGQVRTFLHAQTLDLPGLIGRAFSVSYAPTDERHRERWRDEIERLFGAHQRDGSVRIVYETKVYTARRRERP